MKEIKIHKGSRGSYGSSSSYLVREEGSLSNLARDGGQIRAFSDRISEDWVLRASRKKKKGSSQNPTF